MSELLLCLLIFSDNLHVVPDHVQKRLTSSLCEPNFELSIIGQRVEERFRFAFPVVRTKDRLLEFFLVGVSIWEVKSFATSFVFVFIDEHKTACGKNELTLARKFSNTVDFDLEFDTFSM